MLTINQVGHTSGTLGAMMLFWAVLTSAFTAHPFLHSAQVLISSPNRKSPTLHVQLLNWTPSTSSKSPSQYIPLASINIQGLTTKIDCLISKRRVEL